MKVLIATLVLIMSLAADKQPIEPEEWQNPTVWGNIKAGQTPEQSAKLLGDPIETESTNSIEVWYYSEIPQADENGKMIRPKHGFLMFRKTPTGTTLQKWMEPDWQILPTWEQLQADYKQALAEQKADQQAAQIAERKRIAEEAAEKRQRSIDEQKKQLQPRVQTQTQPKAPSGNEDSGTVAPKRNEHQSSSWLLDNIFIIGCSSGLVILLMVFVYKQ